MRTVPKAVYLRASNYPTKHDETQRFPPTDFQGQARVEMEGCQWHKCFLLRIINGFSIAASLVAVVYAISIGCARREI